MDLTWLDAANSIDQEIERLKTTADQCRENYRVGRMWPPINDVEKSHFKHSNSHESQRLPVSSAPDHDCISIPSND
jgi:hypothetical protein